MKTKDEIKTYRRAYYLKNHAKLRARANAYRAAHKTEYAIYHKRHREKDPLAFKEKRRAITRRYQESGKRWLHIGYPLPTRPRPEFCEICGNPAKGRAMHLDHDHKTNQFRGWLCQNCNRGLGMFRDLPQLLQAAKDYLLGINQHDGTAIDDRFKP